MFSYFLPLLHRKARNLLMYVAGHLHNVTAFPHYTAFCSRNMPIIKHRKFKTTLRASKKKTHLT